MVHHESRRFEVQLSTSAEDGRKKTLLLGPDGDMRKTREAEATGRPKGQKPCYLFSRRLETRTGTIDQLSRLWMVSKRRKSTKSNLPPSSEGRLWQQMSELISLREKVAQAELEVRFRGRAGKEIAQDDKD